MNVIRPSRVSEISDALARRRAEVTQQIPHSFARFGLTVLLRPGLCSAADRRDAAEFLLAGTGLRIAPEKED